MHKFDHPPEEGKHVSSLNESDPEKIRSLLHTAWLDGRDVTLTATAAAVASLAMSPRKDGDNPPGTYDCFHCEGRGVINSCVVCGSDEAGRGSCGSDDPRALCNFKPTQREVISDVRQREAIHSIKGRLITVANHSNNLFLIDVIGMPEWDLLLQAVSTASVSDAAICQKKSVFQDEIDAASAGWDWIQRFRRDGDRLEMLETSAAGRVPRVKWAALFDSHERLTHAYLLTRDEMNMTQLTLVEAAPREKQSALRSKEKRVEEILRKQFGITAGCALDEVAGQAARAILEALND